jgi:hypothetical protein
MRDVAACIPTIDRSPHLYPLVDLLCSLDIKVRCYVNSEGVALDPNRLAADAEVIPMYGESIYAEWNDAVSWAEKLGRYLLVLNDDVTMQPCVPKLLVDALEENPTYSLMGVAEGQGMCAPSGVMPVSHPIGNRYAFSAWCFLARPSMWQDVDPEYRIWYGDDDLIWKVNRAGHGVGALRGVGVVHHVSTTTAQVPWVMEAAHQDGIRWQNSGH